MKLASTIISLFVVASAALSVGNVHADEGDPKNMTVALVNTTNATNSTGENQTEVMPMAKVPSPSPRRVLLRQPSPAKSSGILQPYTPPGSP